MQDDPRYDDVVADVAALPRGAARLRGRGGDPGGADLPRPRHRVRQDRRAQPRAARAARRARRARPPAPRRRLAQALPRPAARRPGRAHRARSPPASPRRIVAYERGATLFRVHDVARARRGAPWRGRRGGGVSDVTSSSAGSSSWASTAPPRRSGATASRSSSTSSSSLDDAGDGDGRARGHARLPRGRRGSCARSRTGARTSCSRRSPPRAPTRSSSASPSPVVRVRVRKPDVVLDAPVEYSAATVERVCARPRRREGDAVSSSGTPPAREHVPAPAAVARARVREDDSVSRFFMRGAEAVST